MSSSESAQQAPLAHPWLKDFVLTWLSRFGIFLAHHVTRPLLPLYLITFGASSTVIGAVMAVFTITATVMRIPIGLLIDRVGRKPFLLYGIAFFTAGKLGYLWAPSILLMLPFRVLHGLGWSGCTTAVSTINADIVPQARRGELMGYAGMASSLASALGPVLGFALFHRFDYSGVFLGASALLVLSFIFAVPVTEPKRRVNRTLQSRALDRQHHGQRIPRPGHRRGVSFLRPWRHPDVLADPRFENRHGQSRHLVRCLRRLHTFEPAHRRTDLGSSQPSRRDHSGIDIESRRHPHASVRDNVQ